MRMTGLTHFVVVGGSYAGINSAKAIFAEAEAAKTPIKLTLVSASTHSYYNIAAPRYLVEPDLLDEKITFDVEKSLRKHAEINEFEFIYATVKEADFDLKTVKYSKSNDDVTDLLSYDYLVLASGCRYSNKAFKLNDSHENTLREVLRLSKSIKSATNVAVIGGGATGVETAGEIASAYPDKKIHLYCGSGILQHLGERVSREAKSQLEELNVNIIPNIYYTGIETLSDGKQKVIFNNDTSKIFDEVITATANIPNTEFIPDRFKNAKGYVKTNEFLALEKYENVLAIGDVADKSSGNAVDILYYHLPVLKKYIQKNVFKKNVIITPVKSHAPIEIVPISRKGGVGVAWGWSLPNFVIWLLRSRNYGIPAAGKFLQ